MKRHTLSIIVILIISTLCVSTFYYLQKNENNKEMELVLKKKKNQEQTFIETADKFLQKSDDLLPSIESAINSNISFLNKFKEKSAFDAARMKINNKEAFDKINTDKSDLEINMKNLNDHPSKFDKYYKELLEFYSNYSKLIDVSLDPRKYENNYEQMNNELLEKVNDDIRILKVTLPNTK